MIVGNPEDLIGSWEVDGRITNQSLLWDNFFKRLSYSKATCNRCGQELATTHGNTTGMARHLEARHSQDWQIYCQQRREKKVAKAAREALAGDTNISDGTLLL